MLKEEEKEYFKILGVDKYLFESRFFCGYVILFIIVYFISDLLFWNFWVEVGDGIYVCWIILG